MHYHLEFYYQPNEGHPHRKIFQDELVSLIGQQLFSMIWDKAHERIDERSIPEVVAFFERGGRQVIATDLTSRGNVYVELVET